MGVQNLVLHQCRGDDRLRCRVHRARSEGLHPAATLAALDPDSATEVDYVAERDTATPVADRGRWRVLEDTLTLTGERKRDPMLTLRRVFVHSTARARAAASARAKKLNRARDDLDRLGLSPPDRACFVSEPCRHQLPSGAVRGACVAVWSLSCPPAQLKTAAPESRPTQSRTAHTPSWCSRR